MSSYNNHYTQKKARQCHQQAIFTLQKIFPQANLSQLSKNSSVWQMLQRSAKNLPRPGLGDITSTITNMKCVVDNQELKIQKNMIEIEREQEMIMSTQKQQQQQYQYQKQSRYGNKYYQHAATKRLFSNNNNNNIKYQSNDNLQSSSYYPQSQYNNNQMDQQQHQQQQDYVKIQIQSKQQFFGDDEIDYFTPCNPVRESFIGDDDQEDVKKYLAFDF